MTRSLWLAAVLVLVDVGAAGAQQMLRYGFEAREPVWVRGPHDAAYKETLHRLTEEFVHGGQRSETIQIDAERGSFIHYTYPVGRAPVGDDFSVGLWVRASRPGVQLLARVVLPRELDAANPGQPLTTLLEGDRYQIVNYWQPLSLPPLPKLLRQQQSLLAGNLKREINIEGAYVDQLVLNVYAGPGETKVWIDDLEVGPVFDAPAPASRPAAAATPARPAFNHLPDEVRLEGRNLKVGGEKFFLMGIRYTGTKLPVLRTAGFNTVWLDESAPSGLIEDAANLGFWIVPTLHPPEVVEQPGGGVPARLVSRETFARNVNRFLREQAVLGWDLGGNRTYEQNRAVLRTAAAVHGADPMRPLAVDVSDGFRNYAAAGNQQLMIGAHRWPLLTSLELPAYRTWLTQRRLLLPPDTFCWTWVQTHLPDWFLTCAYEKTAGNFEEPIGPHPEQIRLLAYTAVGAGYRGVGYWSDRFLADPYNGRDRLLGLALLNQEFRMLEPLLASAKDPQWITAEHYNSFPNAPPMPNPNVQAAVLYTDRAVVVLPIWMGPGSQYVPPRGHLGRLKLKVPLVPENYLAWEVSPGRFRSYTSKPVLGGREVVLENFNLTKAIVFTGDLVGPGSLVVRFQQMQRALRKDAAQWSHDQAQEEIAKVARVHEELKEMKRTLPDGDALLETAKQWLEKSRKLRVDGEFDDAYADAQLALGALRLLMREHWDAAMKRLTTPVASPYAVSFYTLPRFWKFVEEAARLRTGQNLLNDGDFELPPGTEQKGWQIQDEALPDEKEMVEMSAKRVANQPREGKQCLMLKISPKNAALAPQVLERTFLALHSPAVRLAPGSTARISGWVRVPEPITASPDGALLFDSAGGEPLAVRLSGPTPWRQFVLYRTVPPSGQVNVTLALTGFGTVYFDDIRIEPMLRNGPPEVVTTSATAPR